MTCSQFSIAPAWQNERNYKQVKAGLDGTVPLKLLGADSTPLST